MPDALLHQRLVAPRLCEALEDTPVVLIHGPRQCGKTTLARMVGDKLGSAYFSFDDNVVLAAVQADPSGFVAELPERVILDEIQRVPELFPTIKAAVDRRRVPGRFLLTGSANIFMLPKLSESLAGRMEILRLHPLAQVEIAGKPAGFLHALFHAEFKTGSWPRLGAELPVRIAAGGYPSALARTSPRRRVTWYRDYIETLVQRDVRDFSRVGSLNALPRLLALVAAQTARLINIADLSSPFQLSRPTIRDYVTLLDRVFLIEELAPWHNNRLKRLVKTPKLHVGDTGLACALLGVNAAGLTADRALLGQLLETFVYQELRRQASGEEEPVSFFHFRDKDGAEVDVVLEGPGRQIAGIEIKASGTVKSIDFSGLRKLQSAAGKHFAAGVVLYDGEVTVPFGDRLYAVPLRRLWETR